MGTPSLHSDGVVGSAVGRGMTGLGVAKCESKVFANFRYSCQHVHCCLWDCVDFRLHRHRLSVDGLRLRDAEI